MATEAKTAQGETNEQQKAGQSTSSVQTTGEGRQGPGIARRSSYFPSLFSFGPREIFSASPFELMRRFSDEMNRVFEDFGLSARETPRGLSAGGSQVTRWSPTIEVFQREGNLVVRAELPGLNKDDVQAEVTDEGLVIHGERKSEHEERREGLYRSERSYGQFYRLIPLPDDIDAEQVRAQFNQGVLEITIPIPEAQKQRRRQVPIGEAQSVDQSKSASAKQK